MGCCGRRRPTPPTPAAATAAAAAAATMPSTCWRPAIPENFLPLVSPFFSSSVPLSRKTHSALHSHKPKKGWGRFYFLLPPPSTFICGSVVYRPSTIFLSLLLLPSPLVRKLHRRFGLLLRKASLRPRRGVRRRGEAGLGLGRRRRRDRGAFSSTDDGNLLKNKKGERKHFPKSSTNKQEKGFFSYKKIKVHLLYHI